MNDLHKAFRKDVVHLSKPMSQEAIKQFQEDWTRLYDTPLVLMQPGMEFKQSPTRPKPKRIRAYGF